MIRQQPEFLTTTVQFGHDNIGTVGLTVTIVTAGLMVVDGRLTIQQLATERRYLKKKIGDPIDPKKDIDVLPKVVLNFTDPKSIDAMIICLTKLKEKMEYPFPSYCYCA